MTSDPTLLNEAINYYCDESCHLERDGLPVMILGALRCPESRRVEVRQRLKEIRQKHGLAYKFEAKWSKVSPAKAAYYLDLLDYFFDDDDLQFRAIIATKAGLDHEKFAQDHDQWYNKMYYLLLRELLDPEERSRVYIDIKDTRGAARIATLESVLANRMYDYRREVLERVQQVRSHEVEQMQLVDLLVGIVGYANRGLSSNAAKVSLVERAKRRSKYDLTRTTLRREKKFNLFVWHAQGAGANEE